MFVLTSVLCLNQSKKMPALLTIPSGKPTSRNREPSMKSCKLLFTSKTSTQQGETKSTRTRKAFVHPFNDGNTTSIFYTSFDVQRSWAEFVGPEMVSAHYENFAMSRKYAIAMWGGLAAMTYFSTHRDFHMFAAGLFVPYFFWFGVFYFALEAKKSLIKPFQTTFYSRIAQHEFCTMLSYFNDHMRVFVQDRLAEANEQIDYYSVHTDYHSIKAESINRFLAIEQVNLKNHINNRAAKLLYTAEQMEVSNQRQLINSIVSDAISEVDKTLTQNLDGIQDQMFESALIGIRNQQMTYENDPLLPLIRERIQAKIAKLTTLTEAEKVKLVQLSEDQIESLRVLDRQIRDEYIKKVPKIDQSLRAYPQVKKALDNWGR